MSRKLLIPSVAVVLLLFAVLHALYVQRSDPETPPPVPPPLTPFGQTLAGAGIVEPNTEASATATIAIGSQLSGIVAKVYVGIR